MARAKDKIEKYLDRLIKLNGGTCQESTTSRYYQIGSEVIRVSDHCAVNSVCTFSIVLGMNGSYIIYNPKTQRVSTMEYKVLRTFLKNMLSFSPIFGGNFAKMTDAAHLNKQISKLQSELGRYQSIAKTPEVALQHKKSIDNLTRKIVELKKQIK